MLAKAILQYGVIMSMDEINVTKWNNQKQSFLDVGYLIRDASLDRENPLVGMSYHVDYLTHNLQLSPISLEVESSRNLLSDKSHNTHIPKFFRQFVLNDFMKLFVELKRPGFVLLDQFNQLQFITEFVGEFAGVHLNHDKSTQEMSHVNNLNEAATLLIAMQNEDFQSIPIEKVGPLINYHPKNPNVKIEYKQLDGQYSKGSLHMLESASSLDEVLVLSKLMAKAGINITSIRREVVDGAEYLFQTDSSFVLDAQMKHIHQYNTSPISPYLIDARYIDSIDTISESQVSQLLRGINKTMSADIMKRALFFHVFERGLCSTVDLNLVESDVVNSWALQPQGVDYLEHVTKQSKHSLLPGIPKCYHIELGKSSYTSIAAGFGVQESDVTNAVSDIVQAYSEIDSIADTVGASRQHLLTIKKSFNKTIPHSLLTPNRPPTPPLMDM